MDIEDVGAYGSTYTGYKWIFIAAQSSYNVNQEQKIKGAIAHELCHYILRLIYENQEKPFRICDTVNLNIFEEIVLTYKRLLFNDIQDKVDDECDGIITAVYKRYKNEDQVAELIVRVPQILAQFAHDIEKCTSIEIKFNLLFDFYEKFVVPELKKFNLRKLEDIKKLNKNVGVLQSIDQILCDFSPVKDPRDYIDDQLVIIVTNIPKLFLISSYKYFQSKYANFVDSNAVFVTPEIIKNQSIFCDFKKVLTENTNLSIFVDCSAEFGSNIKQIIVNKSSKYFFVIFYDEDYDDLAEYLKDVDMKIIRKEINFDWNDLDQKTQQHLINTKVKFQRKPKIPLIDILEVEKDEIENLDKVIDYQLLDLLINRSEILINVESNEVDDKIFRSSFLNRILIKNVKTTSQRFEPNGMIPVNSEEVSPENLFQDSTTNIVLISDVAGTGKSWMIKNIVNTVKTFYPKKWITYVDLKQCIKMLKTQTTEITFFRFMTQIILKTKNYFEKRIFEKMYKNGTTCIFFDGYDEIASNYGELIIKIFRSFESKNGNQMWITTRDYLEKELQDKLHLNAVYKIKKFTKNDGIDLISSSWIINEIDMEADSSDFRTSKKYQDYQELAKKLCNKISESEQNLIEIPQFYAMIADVFKDNKTTAEKISNFFIYFKFVEKQFEIWAYENVELRIQDRIDAESKSQTYTEIHQYLAMRGLFPNISQFCQLIHDKEDWSDTKIVDCGLITKRDENFIFPHKTLMEYLAADFIVKTLKNNFWQNYSDFFQFLIKFMTDPRFNIVRMFFNDALSDGVILRKLDNKIHRFSKEFCNNSTGLENFSAVFKENHENLVNFLQIILKNGSYNKVKELLHHNIREIINKTKNSQSIINFQSFYIGYLNPADLKDFLVKRNVLINIINSKLNFEVFEDLIKNLEEEIDQNYVEQTLKQRDHADRNLFSSLCWSKGYNAVKLERFLRIVKKYLYNNSDEVFNMIAQCDNYGNNILHICVEKQDEKALEFTWTILDDFFNKNFSAQMFKELINQQTSFNNHSMLHVAANCKNINLHSTLWSLVSKKFENRDDLWDLISKLDKNGYNFVHHLVSSSTASIIDYTFSKIKIMLSDAHYQMILNSKGFAKRNLLQTAICNSKDINLHQVLWTIFKNSKKSGKEFFDFLNEVDIYFWNVFQLAASFTTDEIFEFIIKEVEEIGPAEEIKKILANFKTWKRSLLLIAAECNKSARFHEILWKYIRKYFNSSEIMEIIKHTNKDGKNLLMMTSERNTQEITNLTWNEIIKSIERNETNEDKLIKMIQPHSMILKSILNIQIVKDDSTKIPSKNLLSDPFGIFPSKHTTYENSNDLRSYASCDQLEVHENLWEFTLKTFENRDDLINLILQKDTDGNNFLHLLTIKSKPEIIEFTFTLLKNNLSFKHFQDVLKSKGFKGRDLLQTAACASRDVDVHRVLLNNIRNSCKSEKDFFVTLDEDKRNILECVLCFSSIKVATFMIEELTKIGSSDVVKKLLQNVNNFKENLMQSVIRENKSLESHENLWRIIREYFDALELMESIKHIDNEGNNILQVAVLHSPAEILKLTWKEVNNITDNFDDKEMVDLIQHIDNNGRNLIHMSIDTQNKDKLEFLWTEIANYFNNKNQFELFEDIITEQSSSKGYNILHHASCCEQMDFQECLWTLLTNTLTTNEKLKNLIIQIDKNGNNFIHLVVVENNPKIIEFLLKTLEENLNQDDFYNILQSTGFEGRNIIQRAICESENIEMHENLWRILKNSCKLDRIFFNVIGHQDDHQNNIFHLLACFSTCETFELTVENLEKNASSEEIKKLLINLDFWKRNFMQIIAESNTSLKYHESFWTVIRKHLDAHEIFEIIKNKDEDGKNFLKIINDKNDENLINLTWIEMSKFVNGNEHDEKELMEVVKNYDTILKCILKPQNASTNNPNLLNDPFQILTTSRIIQKDSNDLQAYVTCDQIKVHQMLWDYLLKTFDNREELKNLIIQKDKEGNNFIHLILSKNKIDIIEFTFRVIKDIFDDCQYLEIIKSKNSSDKNLLQLSLQESIDIEITQFIWRVLKNSRKSDQEFLVYIKEVDGENMNIMNICAENSAIEVFQFLIGELEKIATLEDICQLLRNVNKNQRNLLQLAVVKKQSLNFLTYLWEIMCKYFSLQEMSDMISNSDTFGRNILHNCVAARNTENLMFIWTKCKDFFIIIESKKMFKDLIKKQTNDLSFNVLDLAAYCENSEFHETLWIFLLETFEDRNELHSLFMHKSKNLNNYISILVSENNADIFDITVKKLKEHLSDSQFNEILKSRSFNDRTLLQRTACLSKDIIMHQAVWKTVRDLYNSDAGLFKSLKDVDKDGNNLIHLAAQFGSSDTFNFTILKLEEFATHDEIKIFLSTLGFRYKNFMQGAATWNKSIETHEVLWKNLSKYYTNSEIVDIIKHTFAKIADISMFALAVQHNSKEVVEFTWEKIKFYIKRKEDRVNLLKGSWKIGETLHELSKKNKNYSEVQGWVENLLREYNLESIINEESYFSKLDKIFKR